jgi:hypothetical protein
MPGDLVYVQNPIQILDRAGVPFAIDPNTQALRITPRPIDVGALGAYSVLVSTGTMAAGLSGGSTVFSVRWGDATRLALIRRVAIAMMSLGTGFTAGIGLIDMAVARAFSASDTGGTAVTLTTNNAKKRTSFGTSLFPNANSDMRISSTAALTPGTRTLDANAMAGLRFGVSVAINTVMQATQNIFGPDLSAGEWPLVLATNEGFILRATVPATGTWQLDVALDWSEVAAY